MSAPQNGPLISVAICTYGRYDLLPKTIDAVRAQTFDAAPFDIYVIDNNPPSVERSAMAARYAGIPNLHYGTVDTPGLSNARNIAALNSRATYIAYLDDDAVPQPQWLPEIAQGFAFAGSRAGVVGGRVLPDFSLPRPPWLHDKLLGYLSTVDWPGEGLRELLPESGQYVVGANMAFVRQQVVDFGGFDQSLGRKGAGAQTLLGGEDDVMIYQVQKRGFGVFYNPAAEVSHYVPPERLQRDWFRRRLAWSGVNDQMLLSIKPGQEADFWHIVVDFKDAALQRGCDPLLGLVADTDDPELFLLQVQAARFLTRLLLGKGAFPVPLLLDTQNREQ